MRRLKQWIGYGLFWAAVCAAVATTIVREQRLRRTLRITACRIDAGDSVRQSLLSAGQVRRWLVDGGIDPVGKPLDEAPLGRIERRIASHAEVSRVAAYVDRRGVLGIEVAQRRPLLRLRLARYDGYLAEDGWVFRAPQGRSAYVPVVTGSIVLPFGSDYEGPADGALHKRIDALAERRRAVEGEKVPLYRDALEVRKAQRRVRHRTLKRGWREDRELFAKRVARLRQEKQDSLRWLRWREAVIAEGLSRIDARMEELNREEKYWVKKWKNFGELANFVSLVEHDDFWRAMFTEIVAREGSDGRLRVELVPRAGDMLVVFGPLERTEEKLQRLSLLLREVLPAEGWQSYRRIDLSFKDQIVCTK